MKFVTYLLVILGVLITFAIATEDETKQTNPVSNVFLTLRDGPENTLRALGRLSGKRGQKATIVKNALVAHATQSQKPILDYLKEQNLAKVEVESFWISDQIYVRGANRPLISALRARFGRTLRSIHRETFESLSNLVEMEPLQCQWQPRSACSASYTWGVQRIQAPEAWALPGGNNGVSAVVGGIDTGVRVTHVALRNNFVGTYGWFDPNEQTPTPNDQNGHGTHTMGTMVGAGGIGVSPGSKWMACKGCEGDQCAQSDLLACGQFMLCPTLADKSQPDCNKLPDVINNSWGGVLRNNNYADMISAWRKAGIVPVFAIGNQGQFGPCSTAGSPGDSRNVIGVGATTSANALADFSSRGPVNEGLFRTYIKPDVAAPGQGVNSSWYTGDNAYNTISGTSMASPHKAGVVALMVAVNPDLTYDQVKQNLLQGCTTQGLRRPTVICESAVFGYPFPNNEFGQGLINALNSVRRVIG